MKLTRKSFTTILLVFSIIITLIPMSVFADGVVNLNGSLSITEGDSAVLVDSTATVISGDFANGYVQMSTSTRSQFDQLAFRSNSNPNANGAISIQGSTVFLGDGSSKLAIGTIDPTYNGQNGQPLRINYVTPMANSGFENGESGWDIQNKNFPMSGDSIDLNSDSYSAQVVEESNGNHYLHMTIYGSTNSYGTGHGPYATSSYFEASPGDIITFDWKAAKTSDYFDVYAYLINDKTNQTFQILDERGASISTWQTKEITLNSSYLSEFSDKLKFRFVCGSYDATGGTVIGSNMDIDNAKVVKSYATPEICQSILRQITYQNTSEDPVTSVNITAELKDKNGTIYTDTKSCSITPVNDSPTLANNNELYLDEAGNAIITSELLKTQDVDDTAAGLTYTINSAPANGIITLNGVLLSQSGTFTQADIDANLIKYWHNGSLTSYDTFTFTVADGGEDGATSTSGTFTIDINSAPIIITNEEPNLDEGAEIVIDTNLLSTSDVDNTSAQLVYTLTNCPANGTLKKNGSVMNANSTFTQADLVANNISYAHNGGETTSDTFDFAVSDTRISIDDTFNISINPINDSPDILVNNTLTVLEQGEGIITDSLLNENDPDDSGAGMTYTITTNVVNGVLRLDHDNLSSLDTFTQQDIDDGLLIYIHDGTETTSDSFSFALKDGGEDESNTYFGEFNITVTLVNDATTTYDQTFNVIENASIDTFVGQVDTYDEEEDLRTLSIKSGNPLGIFAIDNDGNIYVAGDVDYDTIPQHQLTIEVTEHYDSSTRTVDMIATIDVISVHDTPKTPIAPDLEAASDSGRSDDDDITFVTSPTIFGENDSVMIDNTVKVYVDGMYDGETIADSNGAWSYTIQQTLADGEYDITIISTDLGGDDSIESEALTITIDTTAPSADTAMDTAFEGNSTEDRTPGFVGSGEIAAIVEVFDQTNKSYGNAIIDANGDFDFTVGESDALNIGEYDFSYTLTDIAGNTSELSPVLSIIINDTPTAADTEATTDEDIPYVFNVEDFKYSDDNSDPFSNLKITSLPDAGTIEYFDGEWKNVVIDQEIGVPAIENGELRFVPVADENGEDYTCFDFMVNDGIDYSYESYTFTINVTPVNDVQLFNGLDGTEINYLEDQGTALLDAEKNAQITDIDDTTLVDGRLEVAVTANLAADEDMLSILEDEALTLSDGINIGSLITIDEQLIGTVTNSGLGQDLTIALTVNATLEKVEQLISCVAYENMNTVEPNIETRTIIFTLVDRDEQTALQSVEVLIERTNIATVEAFNTYRHNIDADKALCKGQVLSDGKAPITEVGIVYSLRSSFEPSEEENMVAGEFTSETEFNALLQNLPSDTMVYYSMYALNSEGYGYSEVMTLRTHNWSDRNGDGELDNPDEDTDGDGVSDADEVAAGSDPDNGDSTPSDIDGDGEVDNPNADTDGDGISDADEIAAGSNPDDGSSTPADIDGNGDVDNPNADTDGDGISDAEEQAAGSNPNDPSSTPSDIDGDGEVDNPDVDTDGDGVSDADEVAAGSNPDDPSSTPADVDGDGSLDNPEADTDGDGISDADEVAAGSDPNDPYSTPSDKDADGEVDDPDADSDGDGISDADEVAAGSDPDDPMSKPVVEGQAAMLQRIPADAPAKPEINGIDSFDVWQSMQGTTSKSVTICWNEVNDADYYLVWNNDELLGVVYQANKCVIVGLESDSTYNLSLYAFKMNGEIPAHDDEALAAAEISAVTYGDDGLPMQDIMDEYFGEEGQEGSRRYDLTGQITDNNGMPLAGLVVELHSTPRTTTTDENGWYYFDDVEVGEHTIYVNYNNQTSDFAFELDNKENNEEAAGNDTIYFDRSVKIGTIVFHFSMDDEENFVIERAETYNQLFALNNTVNNGISGLAIWGIILGICIALAAVIFVILKKRREIKNI